MADGNFGEKRDFFMIFVTVLQTMNIKLSISTENILEQETTS